MNDLNLFRGLKEGDRKAINEIYKVISPRVISWIKNNSGSEDDAYDIFQETLEVILLKIDLLDSNLSGLILRIAQRKWIDKLRKNKRVQEQVKKMPVQELGEEEKSAVVEHEKHKLMDQTYSSLSELCQKLIAELKKGVAVESIVQSLGLASANTLYRRKSACIERWAVLIKEQNSYKEIFN